MIFEEGFREVISGRRRGMLAAGLRTTLTGAEVLYSIGVKLRNRRYGRILTSIHRVEVPVISVGNLTTGGTGKTPMVAWVAGWFRARGLRVALISRGYGAPRGGKNDEALELELRLPDVPHLQNPNRVAAARQAIDQYQCQVIVLDDAFQHRRIHRDLDIVLIDALEPFGYGHLLPRGLLREPLSSLARAHVIALSRSDLVEAPARVELLNTIRRFASAAIVIELAHRPSGLIGEENFSAPINNAATLTALRGQRVAAFCGIGNPLAFRRTLENSGVTVAALREFPDHHRYTQEDLSSLAAWADALDVSSVLCTMKDFVKLRVERIGRHALRALSIEVEILCGGEEIESRLLMIASHCAKN